jgi:hypothetical protein
VEDGIDIGVGVNAGCGEILFVTGLRAEICTGAGVCASCGLCVRVIILLGFQVGVFKCVRSSWGTQVGAFCEFLVSIFRWIFRWSKPPHHAKVNPLGEEDGKT